MIITIAIRKKQKYYKHVLFGFCHISTKLYKVKKNQKLWLKSFYKTPSSCINFVQKPFRTQTLWWDMVGTLLQCTSICIQATGFSKCCNLGSRPLKTLRQELCWLVSLFLFIMKGIKAVYLSYPRFPSVLK